jgi:hypothetical protein
LNIGHHLDIVEYLVSKGANVNEKNGLAPLYLVSGKSHNDVVSENRKESFFSSKT